MIRLGPFELDAPMGHGGMGEVWSARHVRQGTPVAVKFLTGDAARESSFRAAFRNEVRASASLDHPHIVLVYDHGEVDPQAELASGSRLATGTPYLAMEMVSGGTLVSLAGRLGWVEMRHIVLSLLDALAHAHARGVLHRDIKPGNVLISREVGVLPTVKLTDFGLAHPLEGSPDSVHFFGGTPSFMAPEQFGGQWRDYGPWTDLYSFGCLVYSLVRGQPPFGSTTTLHEKRRQHLQDEPPPLAPTFAVPAGFEDWVLRLLEKDPSKRFRRAADAAWSFLELDTSLEIPSAGPPVEVPSRVDTLILGTLITLHEGSRAEDITLTQFPESTGEMAMTLASEHADPPPFPPSWRRSQEEWRATQLLSAGLGLFGLREVPLADREVERDRLWSTLGRVRNERVASLVALKGPSGSGKSRLAKWLCERSHEVGASIVLRASHSPIPGPLHGLGTMIGNFLRCRGLSRAEVLERVKAIFKEGGTEHRDEWEAMTELILPASSEERGAIRFTTHVERHVTIRRLLKGICVERPVVIWLDDVQWGLDALGFVRYLLDQQRAHPEPILIVVTATDEALAERSDESTLLGELLDRDDAVEIPVGALPESHRAYLVESLLGLDKELARRVEERTGGNPLFAVQLVGDWVERNLLIPGENGYRLPDDHDIELPADVQAMWAGRVRRLLDNRSEAEGCALELAAVLGTDVDVDEWLAVCSWSSQNPDHGNADPSEQLLDDLLDVRLARAGEGGPARGWSFAHVMLREALETRAHDEGRLAMHHKICSQVLKDKAAVLVQPAGGLQERIGRHLLSSGQLEQALEPILAGVESRSLAGDFAVADALLDMWDAAMTEAGIPSSDQRWGQGWLRRYAVSISRGDYDQVEKWLDKIQAAIARYPWPEVSLVALCRRGQLARLRGDLHGAAEALERVTVIAEEMEDGVVMALSYYELGYTYADQGLLERADSLTRKGLAEYDAMEDRLGAARCWQSLGQIAMQRGDYEQAMVLLEQAELIFEDCGDRWGMASAANSMGDVARNNSDLDGAQKLYRRARGLLRAIGSHMWIFPDTNIGLIHLVRSEYPEARTVLERALSAFTRTGHSAAIIGCHLGLSACAASRSRWVVWDRHFGEATNMIETSGGADEDSARCAGLAGDSALARGDSGRARAAYLVSMRLWAVLGRAGEVGRINEKIASLS